jgi:hypothetical protein
MAGIIKPTPIPIAAPASPFDSEAFSNAMEAFI